MTHIASACQYILLKMFNTPNKYNLAVQGEFLLSSEKEYPKVKTGLPEVLLRAY